MGAKWISGEQVDLNLYSTVSGYRVVEKFDRYEAVLDAELLSVVAKLKG